MIKHFLQLKKLSSFIWGYFLSLVFLAGFFFSFFAGDFLELPGPFHDPSRTFPGPGDSLAHQGWQVCRSTRHLVNVLKFCFLSC